MTPRSVQKVPTFLPFQTRMREDSHLPPPTELDPQTSVTLRVVNEGAEERINLASDFGSNQEGGSRLPSSIPSLAGEGKLRQGGKGLFQGCTASRGALEAAQSLRCRVWGWD